MQERKKMNTMLDTLLAEAGCSPDRIGLAEQYLEIGRREELLRLLRICRCDLMDELHESQKKVDRLDALIRHIKKG